MAVNSLINIEFILNLTNIYQFFDLYKKMMQKKEYECSIQKSDLQSHYHFQMIKTAPPYMPEL